MGDISFVYEFFLRDAMKRGCLEAIASPRDNPRLLRATKWRVSE